MNKSGEATMKRLLLHIGYPKAASTSLQNGLFLALHREHAINFLGRAFESGFYGTKKSRAAYKDWFDHVVGTGAAGRAGCIGELSATRLNVLSEGLFMMNERRSDHIVGPGLLHKHFSAQAESTDILLVIRRQGDLIPSYYTQNYRKLEQKLFAEYLAHNIQQGWSGEAKIFNFRNVLHAYAEVFGRQHIHVVLFEDFVNNRERFSTQLAHATGVEPGIIAGHLGEEHLNQTRKEAGTLVIRKLNKHSIRNRAIRALQALGSKYADSLRVRIPAVTEEERRVLFDSFKDSNLQLAEEFSLDKQAMREYEYF
jgi:hypothetical protein